MRARCLRQLVSTALRASQLDSDLRPSLSAVSYSGIALLRMRNQYPRRGLTLVVALRDDLLRAESRRPEGGGVLIAEAKPERAESCEAAC